MSKFLYGFKRITLTIFGDIKIFKWPMFVIYQPTSFRIKGFDTRTIMANIQPGDVVMRSYDDYLDGYFIPKGSSGCSHSGVYIGENNIVIPSQKGRALSTLLIFAAATK